MQWSLEDLVPGDPAGLPALHALVPAAEERDLLDEARAAEHREDLLRLDGEIAQPWDEPLEPDPADEVLLLLRRTFGATVILAYDEPPPE